jgi:outer membrane lipoprotein SlyB
MLDILSSITPNKIMRAIFAILAASILLGACAGPSSSGNVYSSYQTMNEQSVRMGTVESVRNVTIANPDSGVGTMSGAALGGLAGSAAGSGRGEAAMGIVGAVAGGIIGNRVEDQVNHKPGFEITVRLDNGELRSVTQLADEAFRPGERVRLLSNGYTTRVTH